MDDVRFIFAEAAHEYRAAFVGYGGVTAGCVWAIWSIPPVWFFHQFAFPVGAIVAGLRCGEAHFIANGAEHVHTAIQSGNVEFAINP